MSSQRTRTITESLSWTRIPQKQRVRIHPLSLLLVIFLVSVFSVTSVQATLVPLAQTHLQHTDTPLTLPLPHLQLHPPDASPLLQPRANIIIIPNPNPALTKVINADTRQLVLQANATDGGGSSAYTGGISFSSPYYSSHLNTHSFIGPLGPPAIIWVAFCALVGLPMALAGYRLWRFTTGVGVGLAGCVACKYPFRTGSSFLPRLSLLVIGPGLCVYLSFYSFFSRAHFVPLFC